VTDPETPSRAPRPESDTTSIGQRDLTSWRTRAGRRLADWATAAADARPGLTRWILTWRAAIITVLLGGLIVIAATAVAAEVYEQVTEEDDGLAALDRPLLDWFMGHRPEWLADAATWVTHTGGQYGLPVIAVLACAWLWWRRRSPEPVITIAVTAVVALGMTLAGKAVIGRARPPLADAVPPYEHSHAFPSGHTLNATALAIVIGYLMLISLRSDWARITVAVVAVVFSLVIGLTRVYLGHHWLTDVVAGWALAAAWAGVVIVAHRLYLTVWKRRRREAEAHS